MRIGSITSDTVVYAEVERIIRFSDMRSCDLSTFLTYVEVKNNVK